MKKIGVIGHGIVGSAITHGFKKLGHELKVHDIKLNTKIENLLETEMCFVCVPTPSEETGRCNTEIVEQVIDELNSLQYTGIVVIKSTVEPGTTERMIDKYQSIRLAFVPEFLRERCAVSDFIDNHDLCVIGTHSEKDYKAIKDAHGHFPQQFIKCTPSEAELVKYFNNIYNATLITFANNFYEVCESMDVNYANVKSAIVKRDHITDNYLDCNKNFRGFGGACLPKDTKAIAHLVKEKNLPSSLFDDILRHNERYITTVFDGMRMGDET